nr:calphotin-like [Rhipicephalus microplus]
MKVLLLCLFLFLREASCGVIEAPAYSSALVPETGTSSQYRSQDVHGNYQFGYEEKHTSGGSFREETGDAYGNKYGSYGLTDADGRVRIVKYVADANGFRVIVNTNEPGTAPSTPAAASINVPQEPVVPAPVATAAAAPVATVVAAPAPVVNTIVPAASAVSAAEANVATVVAAPAPVVKTIVPAASAVSAAEANVATVVAAPAPVVKTIVPATPVVTAAAAPAVVAAPPPAVVAGPAPAIVAPPAPATVVTAPATVTTIRRFVPTSIFPGPAHAPVLQPAPAVPAVPVFGYRRAVATAPVVASTAAAVSYSSGFVPSLPYAGSVPPPPVRKVIVRKVIPAGYGGGYGLLRGAATSYGAPAVVPAPAIFGARLTTGAPWHTYGGQGVVTNFAGKPLDYYDHLANKLGATYLRRRR